MIDDEESGPKGDGRNEVVERQFHIYDRRKRVDMVARFLKTGAWGRGCRAPVVRISGAYIRHILW